VLEATREQVKKDRATLENSTGFVSGVVEFGSSVAANFTDPVNIALAPFGMGTAVGKGVLGNVASAGAREAGLNAIAETITQPFAYSWKQELGLDYEIEDAIMNVAAATVGGFALGAAGSFVVDAGVVGKAMQGDKTLAQGKEIFERWDSLQSLSLTQDTAKNLDLMRKANQDMIQGKDVEVSQALKDDGDIPLADGPTMKDYYDEAQVKTGEKAVNDEMEFIYREGKDEIPEKEINDVLISTEERDKNFQEWFKDSKAVDESGKPKIVYHGTDADFESFDPSKGRFAALGKGFYFTSNPSEAGRYVTKTDKSIKEGANIMPVYVSIKNPLKTQSKGIVNKEIAKERYNHDFPIPHNSLIGFLRDKSYNQEAITRELKELGFDGVESEDVFVAFEPNQIKSTFNQGAFSKKSPNILDIEPEVKLETPDITLKIQQEADELFGGNIKDDIIKNMDEETLLEYNTIKREDDMLKELYKCQQA